MDQFRNPARSTDEAVDRTPPDHRGDDPDVRAVAAEAELRRLGIDDVEVRGVGDVAFLTGSPAHVSAVSRDPLRHAVVRAVQSAGFRRVVIHLDC